MSAPRERWEGVTWGIHNPASDARGGFGPGRLARHLRRPFRFGAGEYSLFYSYKLNRKSHFVYCWGRPEGFRTENQGGPERVQGCVEVALVLRFRVHHRSAHNSSGWGGSIIFPTAWAGYRLPRTRAHSPPRYIGSSPRPIERPGTDRVPTTIDSDSDRPIRFSGVDRPSRRSLRADTGVERPSFAPHRFQ